MDISFVKINEIEPYEKNPRKNKDAVQYVTESIRQFGFKVPIVLTKGKQIICGHTRWLAAKKLKMNEVPCIFADDLTEEQIRAFRLADNKVSEFAEWDFGLLGEELDDIINIDMSAFGFDDLQVDEEEEQAAVKEDDIPEDVEEVTKRGDIWVMGDHRLLCGDSTSREDVIKIMGTDKVDMFLTDPPYNVNYTGKNKKKMKILNDNMNDNCFREFLRSAFKTANFVMKEGATFYVWHADLEGYNFRGACLDVGWTVRQCLIWKKNTFTLGRQDYHWKHEPCLYGWKDGASHFWAGDRKQTTVIEIDKPTKNIDHPTMKPVELFDYLIKNNTKKGDIVLDLFAGSGTTLIACEQNKRVARIVEIDQHYCDVIVARWEKLTGKKAELMRGDQCG
jgi:site-specific DNA-methyltransferase (adenine-specific)